MEERSEMHTSGTEAEEEKNEPLRQEPSNEKSGKKKKRRRLRYTQSFVAELILVVFFAYLLFGVIFGLETAPNNDMKPAFAAGDLLLYFRFDKDVLSRDIIVFEKNDTIYAGRVIAKEGDTVEITDNEQVVVNGNTIIETDIYAATPRFEGFVDYPLTLNKGECFVLCDSRAGSEDSRYFGPVSRSEIKGTVINILRRNSL